MKHKKIYIIFNLLLAFFCFSIVVKTLPNDTFSTIRIGDYTLKNGINFAEQFNMDSSLIYHNARWLYTIIIALFYNHLDFFGIYLFTIINSIVLGLVMFNSILKRTSNLLLSFLVTLISIEFVCGAIVARAQTVSYVLLFLEVVFLEKLLKDNNKKYIIGLIIISVLIANIHTSIWPMTLILFLPYFAEYIIHKIFKNSKVLYSESDNIKLLSITFIIIALTGLLTPLGLLPYTYMPKTLTGISSLFILELQHATITRNFILVILGVIYFYIFVIVRKKIKISDIFMALGLLFMAIMATRNIPLFIIIGSLCISRLIQENIKDHDYLDGLLDKMYESKLFISFISIAAITISSIFIYQNRGREYVDETLYPVKASDYIIENLDLENLRLYNDFDNGAYLEFRNIKVFLDSRSEVYCKEFNDTSILEDWYNVNRIKVDYKEVFKKYKFNYVLLYNTEQLNGLIAYDSDYKKIYSDEYFVLYEKVE